MTRFHDESARAFNATSGALNLWGRALISLLQSILKLGIDILELAHEWLRDDSKNLHQLASETAHPLPVELRD